MKLKCDICEIEYKNKKSLSNHLRGHKGTGFFIRGDGYIFRLFPTHPFAINGYVLEHRIVMEQKLGRFLESNEVVHHIDANKQNNHPDNLIVLSQSEHCKKEGFGSNLKGVHKTKQHIENWRKSRWGN